MKMLASCFLLATSLLLSGCAVDRARYPSLTPRVAERTGFDEPAIAAPAPVVADPALDAQVATLLATLATVTKGFDADAARARAAARVAGARTVGSDAWLNAQTALATLDDWRAQASEVDTDLEVLASKRIGEVGTPSPALEAARERAAAEAARLSAGIAAIGASLPLP